MPPDDPRRDQLIEHLERLRREGVYGLSIDTPEGPVDPGAATAPVVSAASPEPTRIAASRSPIPAPPTSATVEGNLFGDEMPIAGVATRDESLAPIEAEALVCVACRLHEARTTVVFGVGNPQARLMFIGEGPGRDEDRQGEPFVGRAGQLLNKIIAAMGYTREDVYIANAVKCRPSQNRNPEADEMEACEGFLLRQIAVIRPEIIVLLGRVAVQGILKSSAPMSRLHGKFQEWNGFRVMCTYHPAYLLRNPSAKGMVWEDMKMVRDALAGEAGA